MDAEVNHSMVQGQHLTLRCHPQQRSMPMAPPSIVGTRQESGPPTDRYPRLPQKGERNYLHIVNQHGKA
jgi:hypothetical protein